MKRQIANPDRAPSPISRATTTQPTGEDMSLDNTRRRGRSSSPAEPRVALARTLAPPRRWSEPSQLDSHPARGGPDSSLFRSPAPARAAAASAAEANMRSLPATLDDLCQNLRKMKSRPVDCDLAADVINAVRRQSMATHGTPGVEAAASNKDLAEGITEEHVDQWMRALGLQRDDVDAMKKAAFWSGMSNPFGSDTMTAMSYIATPLIGAATGSPFAALGVGLASAIAAPAVNAYFQSGVVTRGDIYRESKGPTVVLNKNDVNDNLSLQQAADQVVERTEVFGAALKNFEDVWNECKQALPPSNLNLEDVHFQDLTPHQLAALKDPADKVLSSSQAMCDAQQQALMTQGSHARQQVGNANQALPRALRPIGAGLPSFLTGSDKAGRANLVSSMGVAGVQTGAAVLGMLAQHYAAGHDERNKQMYNNKLNMLYADVFNAAGKAKIASGQELIGDDIDPAKLRKLVSSPSEAFLLRVTDAMRVLKKEVYQDIEAKAALVDRVLINQGDEIAFADIQHAQGEIFGTPFQHDDDTGFELTNFSQVPRTPGATIPYGDEPTEPAQKIDSLHEKAAMLGADLEKLKTGDLTGLSRSDQGPGGGVARKIIEEGLASLGPKSSLGMSHLFHPLERGRAHKVNAALEKKYNTEGEFSAQFIQRAGQAFHLGVAGSAAASVIGRVASAAVGGAKNASTAQLAGVTAAAGVLGGIGATHQYVAISEKNHRRANVDAVSGWQQFLNGATAMIREPMGMHASTKAITTANQTIQEALNILEDARKAALLASAAAETNNSDQQRSRS
jgi:hypothetical protein